MNRINHPLFRGDVRLHGNLAVSDFRQTILWAIFVDHHKSTAISNAQIFKLFNFFLPEYHELCISIKLF